MPDAAAGTARLHSEWGTPLPFPLAGNSPTASITCRFLGIARVRGYRAFGLFVHVELENVGPRVMADNIQVVLATDDLSAIDLGEQNRLAFKVRSGKKIAKRIDDATAAARHHRIGIITKGRTVIIREVPPAVELIAG